MLLLLSEGAALYQALLHCQLHLQPQALPLFCVSGDLLRVLAPPQAARHRYQLLVLISLGVPLQAARHHYQLLGGD